MTAVAALLLAATGNDPDLTDLAGEEHTDETFTGLGSEIGPVRGMSFVDCTFTACDLEGLELVGCELLGCTFEDCNDRPAAGDPGQRPPGRCGVPRPPRRAQVPGPDLPHRGGGAQGRHRRVAAHDGHGPGAHVLLLADELGDAVAAVGREGLGGVFEEVRAVGGGRGGHGRRQVDQPAGVDGEPTHHLERGGGVLGPDRDLRLQPGVDDALAEHIGGVEELGRPVGVGSGQLGDQRSSRFVVGLGCGDRDQLTFGIAERGELAAEHASGVDADGVVDVGNDAVAVVEHCVADQPVEEGDDLRSELIGLAPEPSQGLGQSVRHLDLSSSEGSQELVLVVAGDAGRRTVAHHPHDEAQDLGAGGAAVQQVAHEERRPSG